ncbi:hypothetical protein D770_10910 [Flammeovirgaceae bacterium 311]|nr:hypothetical protein D770_10910 [Flammeovirgaceae bacterium 311]
MKQKFFYCYATANDKRLYRKDIINLTQIKNKSTGLAEVVLFIAISEVNKMNAFDKIFISTVKNLFKDHPEIVLEEIFFKDNLGRDMSSYDCLFQKVNRLAGPKDYVFFQNRSGYGPCLDNWYKDFIQQFERFDGIALCGSTINFLDHPSRGLKGDLPHIQTYSFLTNISFLRMLKHGFPGAKETDRSQLIIKGEIGLSQFYLNKGYRITCMEWPDLAISNQSAAPADSDIREEVRSKHQFYHRKFNKRLATKVKSTIISYCDVSWTLLRA